MTTSRPDGSSSFFMAWETLHLRRPVFLHGCLLASVCLLVLIPNAFAGDTPQVPAFPGAEGYGAPARGGRGGKVIAVTNLNDSGPGSLQAACEAEGSRIVVFRVAGTIDGDIRIRNDHITIAGQTAPGDGITIKGNLGIGASDVIIRYIRVRPSASGDAVGGRYNENIILDHVSTSWSNDEVLSLYHNRNVTIQWCMITEACARDDSHRFGGIWGNNYGTYHHNLIAHNNSRNPRWASGCGFNDYRNNVLYNWGYQSCYGGEAHQRGDRRNPPVEFSTINMVANYYKPGPATRSGVRDRIVEPSARTSDDKGSWYVGENVVVGTPEVTEDNWEGVDGSDYIRLDSPWPAMAIDQETPEEAYRVILEHAGCSLPNRDAIDRRIIEEVRTGIATYGENGIITTPSDVGGWPTLATGPAPEDSDSDGMPDAWESRYGLDPSDASDGPKDKDGDGCTNVEEYLNGTDPTEFVDYTNPENNVSTLRDVDTRSQSVQIAPKRPAKRLRVIMTSDFPPIGVVKGGNVPNTMKSDPDDMQSMVRFLLYANEFDIEGLIASAGTFAMEAHKKNILGVIDQYEKVHENLKKHDPNYPTADYLRSVTFEGKGNNHGIPIKWGRDKQPYTDIIGEGMDSEASNAIIAAADKPDVRPIWIGVWGGPREVAQAIWDVKDSRSEEELNAFIGKLRVFLIAYQDATHGWLREEFPDLFIIESLKTYQGMFGGRDPISDLAWVNEHIRHHHGPLCDVYPHEGMGCTGVCEGDSPTFMYLVSANRGINDPEDPTQPSWGGQYKRMPNTNHYVDGPGPSSISKWRQAYQAEFKQRADWCVE